MLAYTQWAYKPKIFPNNWVGVLHGPEATVMHTNTHRHMVNPPITLTIISLTGCMLYIDVCN